MRIANLCAKTRQKSWSSHIRPIRAMEAIFHRSIPVAVTHLLFSSMYREGKFHFCGLFFHVTRNGRIAKTVWRKIRHGARECIGRRERQLSGPMIAAGWIFLSLHWDPEASLVARFPVAVVLHPKLPASHVRLIRLELSGQSLMRLHNYGLGEH